MSGTPSSTSTSPPSNSANAANIDDVEYLLHLEALRRFHEDEKHINRQVEEHTRRLLETKLEYLTQYEAYVTLLKHIGTRHALLETPQLNDSLVESCIKKVAIIAERTSSGKRAAYLNEELLDKCKTMLAKHKARDNLCKQKEELAQNRDTVKAIQAAAERVEASLEGATIQGIQQLTSDLQIE